MRRTWIGRLAALAWPGLALASMIGASGAGAQDLLGRGEYLATIMDCQACHTDGMLIGKPDLGNAFAGSTIGHEVEGLGIFYGPNLTPDQASGLGAWSIDDIIRAVRTGTRPDGRMLAPAMPWRSYAALKDEDAQALAAFLKSLPPRPSKAPPRVVPGEDAKAPFLRLVVRE